MKTYILLFLFCFSFYSFSQSDTVNEIYYNNVVVYSDLGYYSCPFDVKVENMGTLKYRNNIKPFIGLGIVYKWGGLRIGSLINYSLKGLDNYGYTKIFKIGTEFFYKRYLFELTYYSLKGYTLMDNSLLGLSKFTVLDDLNFQSYSFNNWFFTNKKFSHHALKGIKQAVKNNSWTFYLKNTNAITSIQNSTPIVPSIVSNLVHSSLMDFNSIKAIELGLLGGFAYAFKLKKHFQIGGMLGYGGVIIKRDLSSDYKTENYIGLSPRYDFHIYAGYNKKKMFLMNFLDLEQRNIQFSNFEINSNLISYRLVVGYRF
jgi:hypothetical protein